MAQLWIFRRAKYAALFIVRANETPVNTREPDVYHIRQRFYRRPNGFNNSWIGERRRSLG